MAFDLEEQEKIDSLKAWWDRWGNLISGLILAVLLAILGWYAWNWYQQNQTRNALGYFEIVENSYQTTDDDSMYRLQEANQVLQDKYKGSIYTGRSALLAARAYSQKQDYNQAEKELQHILNNKKSYPELLGVATLQLATVYIDQEKNDQALALLDQEMVGYEALFADKRGDIYFSQNDLKEATSQWQQAAQMTGVSGEFVQAMQFKLNVLGGVNDKVQD